MSKRELRNYRPIALTDTVSKVEILSDADETLQRILDIVSQNGSECNVKFGNEMSQVLVMNVDDRDVGRTWRLDGNVIERMRESVRGERLICYQEQTSG